ncbi:hypothetical protein BD626DRAFT_99866 [Schizophyllum amplum]|uniref:Uncharacterized protein n=1 Tax=Schizophyllum amplum TaxID=97359 RepID=A0A550CRH9_9AGAR|nr:hypothetical protein BD626DRAFT_99866 [Auriculariopsis ampla]
MLLFPELLNYTVGFYSNYNASVPWSIDKDLPRHDIKSPNPSTTPPRRVLYVCPAAAEIATGLQHAKGVTGVDPNAVHTSPRVARIPMTKGDVESGAKLHLIKEHHQNTNQGHTALTRRICTARTLLAGRRYVVSSLGGCQGAQTVGVPERRSHTTKARDLQGSSAQD